MEAVSSIYEATTRLPTSDSSTGGLRKLPDPNPNSSQKLLWSAGCNMPQCLESTCQKSSLRAFMMV